MRRKRGLKRSPQNQIVHIRASSPGTLPHSHIKFHTFKASLKIRLSWVGANFYNNQHQRLSLDRLDTFAYFYYIFILDFIELFHQLSSFIHNATSYLLITPLFRNSSLIVHLSLIVPFNIFRTIDSLRSWFYDHCLMEHA
jgi:hypothetical protein